MRIAKRILALLLSVAMIPIGAVANSVQADGEITEKANESSVENAVMYSSPVSPEKKIPQQNIKPGVNIFTGDVKALEFENDDDFGFFYNAQKTTDIFTYSQQKENENCYLNISGGNTDSSWKYCQIAADLEKSVDRPAILMLDIKGNNQCAFWLSEVSGKHIILAYAGQFTDSWKLFKLDSLNKTHSEDAFTRLRIQFGTDSSASDSFGVDNICLVPYYKITYHAVLPNGINGTDRIEYFISDDSSKVTLDGTTITGIADKYTPSGELTVDGYTFLGWTQENGSENVQSSVDLNNSDIDLYPIWQEDPDAKKIVTIYADENAQNVILSQEYQSGEKLILPSKKDMLKYYESGVYEILGFVVNGNVAQCGESIVFDDTMPASLNILPVYAQSDYSGEPVLYENFDYFTDGYSVSENISKTMYISENWESNAENFYIVPGSASTEITVQNVAGKRCANIAQNANERFPQMTVRNKDGSYFDITEPGVYTISADVYVPSEMIGKIAAAAVSIYYSNSQHDYFNKELTASDYGKWIHISHSVKVGADQTAKKVMRLNFHYRTLSTETTGAYCYFDNISLFAKTDTVTVIGCDGEAAYSDYYAAGFDFPVPSGYKVYSVFNKDAKRIKGYTLDNEKYALGEIIPADKTRKNLALSLLAEDIIYRLDFDSAQGNGTIDSICVNNENTVKLPEGPQNAFGFKCWKINKTGEEFLPGTDFTYDAAKYSDYLNDTTLRFDAVYEADMECTNFKRRFSLSDSMFPSVDGEMRTHVKKAYEAGILSNFAEFEPNAQISKTDVMLYAARLYNTVYGRKADFDLYEQNGFESKSGYVAAYLVKNGIMPENTDISGNADVGFAVMLYANALPSDFYASISNKAGVLENMYANKLAKAGIIDSETDLCADLNQNDNIVMISKLVDESERVISEEYRNTFYIIGDSLCAFESNTSWPSKLPKYLSKNINVDNIAVGGNNTRHYFVEGSVNRQRYLRILSEMSEGDVCILALGTNDFWGANFLPESNEYNERRGRYARYALEIINTGAAMAFVCPVGFDTLDENGVYYDSRPSILLCMKDACTDVGQNIPILNFKEISEPYFKSVSEEERERIYSDGTVHYTDPYGATKVCSWFSELVRKNSDESLEVLRSNFEVQDFDNSSEEDLYNTDLPETSAVTSLRVREPMGMRFLAVGNSGIRNIGTDNAEFGFIVTTEELMTGKTDDEFVIDGNIKYVRNFAYNNISGEDKCEFDFETQSLKIYGVLVGIPKNAAAYKTKFAVRSYIKIGENVFYGNVHRDSLYELAIRLKADGSTEKTVEDIINICQ